VDDVAASYQMDVKGLLEDLARLEQATPWLEPAAVVPLSAHPGWRRRPRAVLGAGGPDAVVVDLAAWRLARGR
jgi:hypothetical protein